MHDWNKFGRKSQKSIMDFSGHKKIFAFPYLLSCQEGKINLISTNMISLPLLLPSLASTRKHSSLVVLPWDFLLSLSAHVCSCVQLCPNLCEPLLLCPVCTEATPHPRSGRGPRQTTTRLRSGAAVRAQEGWEELLHVQSQEGRPWGDTPWPR